MNQIDKRPPPPVLKRDGFQLVDQSFGIAGFERVSGSRLKELFNPRSLPLERDQIKAELEARSLFKKAFFAAQLRYYGIKAPSAATVASLKAQLRDAVDRGQCERVADSVATLEAAMRRDYEADHRVWQSAVRDWEAEQERKKDVAFAKCETPGQEAACSPTRFLNRYFLTDGKPDHTKAPEPMVLHGFTDGWTLQPEADKIPGLHISRGGKWPAQTVCIGWGRDDVWALARELTAQAEREVQEKLATIWQVAMEEHEQFTAQTQHRNKPRSSPFNVDSITGSYIVQCQEITESWPDQIENVLTLDIATRKYPGGKVVDAAVNWGIFEGTMLLSLDQDALPKEVSDSEDPFEEEDETDQDDDESNNPRKRTAPSASLPGQPGMKRAKQGEAAALRRVYLSLRGRETGEGEVYPDPYPGHIDFADDACSTFEGVTGIDFIGGDVKFRGYKVSDTPKKEPEHWSAFDGY